jgi:hypothetical protein
MQLWGYENIVTKIPENQEINFLDFQVAVFPNKGLRRVVGRWARRLGRAGDLVGADMQATCTVPNVPQPVLLPTGVPIRNRNWRAGIATSLSLRLKLTGAKHGQNVLLWNAIW